MIIICPILRCLCVSGIKTKLHSCFYSKNRDFRHVILSVEKHLILDLSQKSMIKPFCYDLKIKGQWAVSLRMPLIKEPML